MFCCEHNLFGLGCVWSLCSSLAKYLGYIIYVYDVAFGYFVVLFQALCFIKTSERNAVANRQHVSVWQLRSSNQPRGRGPAKRYSERCNMNHGPAGWNPPKLLLCFIKILGAAAHVHKGFLTPRVLNDKSEWTCIFQAKTSKAKLCPCFNMGCLKLEPPDSCRPWPAVLCPAASATRFIKCLSIFAVKAH